MRTRPPIAALTLIRDVCILVSGHYWIGRVRDKRVKAEMLAAMETDHNMMIM